jgi:VWFA-related protein
MKTRLLCLAAAGVILLSAQEELLIRTETRVVLVDAVAMNRKGEFVRDLTAKDFRLWEDNKEQKITGFSLESAGVSPERSNKHYIAMLFDTATGGQTIQVAMRQEATHFIDSFSSPDRYMAVINYGSDLQITQNFTADSERLRKALSVVQSTAVSNAGLFRDGARNTNTSTLGMDVDTAPYRTFLDAVETLANSLAVIRGRKALVLFSGGAAFTPDITNAVKATIAACNKANVAIYAVSGNTSGNADQLMVRTNNRRLSQEDLRQLTQSGGNDQNLLSTLAEGTGGILFSTTNDLAASLGKVAMEQDQYYLISYTPSVDSPEDSCHELNLKVDRDDVRLRSRKSYCTAKPADPLSGKPAGQELEAKAAAGAGNIKASMQLPWFYARPNVAQVKLVMDFIPSATKFQKEKGKLHGEFDLAGLATKPDGSVAAHFSDTVKLEFDNQKEANEFLKTPYHYVNQFKIGPGQYTFRLAFTSGGESFGKIDEPLTIEPWNGQALGASGLALSRQTNPAADLAGELDASLLEGDRPLVAKNMEVIPAGANQFGTGEPAFLYFEAYEPLLTASKTPVLVGVRLRILDAATHQQKYDAGVKTIGSFEHPGNAVIPVLTTLPNLPAGNYQVEVTVMRETGTPIVRTVDLRIQ